jgi:hypothetical protein
MKHWKPGGTIHLEHDVFQWHGSPDGSALVVASARGQVSWIDLKRGTIKGRRPTSSLRGISMHPREPWFAFCDGKSGLLGIESIHGSQLARVAPPPRAASAAGNWKSHFDACYFDPSGRYLWAAAPTSRDECEIMLFETKGWSVVQQVMIPDAFGESGWLFHATPEPDLVGLWLAAGQEGQRIRWLRRRGPEFALESLDEFANYTPPVFSSDGTEFLLLGHRGSICRVSFPGLVKLGSPLETGDEGGHFTESICYLDDGKALSRTNDGRIFLIDTREMAIEDEISLLEHEPRPVGEYYPGRDEETRLATDISWFMRVGDTILFAYRRERSEPAKDSLVWYSLKG